MLALLRLRSASAIAIVSFNVLSCAVAPDVPGDEPSEVAVARAALTLSDCPAGYNIIEGTAAANTLTGTAGSDCILGYGGHDTISGLGGDDFLIGGPGDDRIYGGDGRDQLYGEADVDRLEGEADDDVLYGGAASSHLYGGGGNDVAYCEGNSNDRIEGGPGDDWLYGAGGFDDIFGGDGQDHIFGEAGADELFGEAGDDIIAGGEAVDWIEGGTGHDVLHGGTENDTIFGNEDNDAIIGGGGVNTVDGGSGTDRCTGTSCELAELIVTGCMQDDQCPALRTCVVELGLCLPCLDDTDLDGTCDATDGCPDDPTKIAAGVCGCGVADTDSDSDGTADCVDGCPNDATKTAAGICGCGVADADTDGDGAADCVDICPGFDDAIDTDDDGIPDGCDLPCEIDNGACGDPAFVTCVSVGGEPECVDIDECLVGGACGAPTAYTCVNNYAAAPSCVDIDECATNNGGCDALTACTNSVGSFSCGSCPSGYAGTGSTGCTDIDECATNNGGCDALTACTNSAGTFSCGSCPSGYTGTGSTGCTDVDECATNNGGCDALTVCTNSAGTFSCGSCPSGYTGTGSTGCTDVNECATNNGGCDLLTACTNSAGSFSCGSCPSGYTGTGSTGCTNINECATANGGCDPLTACIDTPGSHSCGPCPAGYTGTGETGCVLDACPDDPLKTEPGLCGCGNSDMDSDGDGVPDCHESCPGMDDYGFDCFPVGTLRAHPVPGMDMMNAGFSDSTMLGTLVAGTRHPFSADGSTFVGRQPFKSFDRAFRYSWSQGNEWLDGVPGSYPISIAGAASANGEVVGGSGFSSDLGNSALAWGGAHGSDPTPLLLTDGLPDVGTAHIYAVSWDGVVMAGGLASARTGRLYAFRVISAQGKIPFELTDLGSLMPDGDSVALDVSADGSIIVGWTTSDDAGVQHEPFRWTEATGMVGLGLFKKYGNTRGAATAISADGTVIVGWARYQTKDRAFVWTEESGMQPLPLVPLLSADTFAYAVSPDGSVIVGGGYNGSRFVWSAAHGSESLDAVFARLSVDVTGYSGFLPMAVLEMAGTTYLTGIAYADTGEQVIWRAAYE